MKQGVMKLRLCSKELSIYKSRVPETRRRVNEGFIPTNAQRPVLLVTRCQTYVIVYLKVHGLKVHG